MFSSLFNIYHMKKVMSSKWISVGLVVLISWLGGNLIQVELSKREVERKIAGLENKVGEIENSNRSLEEYLANLSNPNFLDKEARIKMNYKSVDEQVVFFFEDKSIGKEASQSLESDYSFWQRIKKIFRRD